MKFRTFCLPVLAAMSISLTGATTLPVAAQSSFNLETVAEGLSYPWSVAMLPDGGFLVTERDGALKHVDATGSQRIVEGVPQVFAQGQGGLLDVVLSPDFENDATVYLTFSQGSPEGAGTSLFKAVLEQTQSGGYALKGETIFAGNNKAYGGGTSAPGLPLLRMARCS